MIMSNTKYFFFLFIIASLFACQPKEDIQPIQNFIDPGLFATCEYKEENLDTFANFHLEPGKYDE